MALTQNCNYWTCMPNVILHIGLLASLTQNCNYWTCMPNFILHIGLLAVGVATGMVKHMITILENKLHPRQKG